MRGNLRRGLAVLLSLSMILGSVPTTYAQEESYGDELITEAEEASEETLAAEEDDETPVTDIAEENEGSAEEETATDNDGSEESADITGDTENTSEEEASVEADDAVNALTPTSEEETSADEEAGIALLSLEDEEEEAEEESVVLAAGTYSVPATTSLYVNAMGGVDFGGVAATTATVTKQENGELYVTLSFSPYDMTIYSVATTVWAVAFGGWYDSEGELHAAVATTTEETELEGKLADYQGTQLTEVSFVIPEEGESYLLNITIDSTVMGKTFEGEGTNYKAEISFDWDQATAISVQEDGEESEVYTGSTTVDGYGYELSVTLTVSDGIITAVEVSSEDLEEHVSSTAYYNMAVAALTESLVGKEATQEGVESVDAVAGATMTKNAIVEAALAALGIEDTNPALDIALEAGATYTVDITFKASAHSLVSDPTASETEGVDAVSVTITVDEDGNATMIIPINNSSSMYVLSVNGIHTDGDSESELTTEGISVTTTTLDDYTCVEELSIALDGYYAEYYLSTTVFVPLMASLSWAANGFTVDPSTLTVDWDSLAKAELAAEDAVAQITSTDGTVTYYASLWDVAEETDEEGNVTTAAVAGALSALQDGDVLTLLTDVEYTGTLTKANSVEISIELEGEATLDLNGYTITAVMTKQSIYLFELSEGSLTVKNGTIDVSTLGSAICTTAGTSLTLEDVTIRAYCYGVVTCGDLTATNVDFDAMYSVYVSVGAESVVLDGITMSYSTSSKSGYGVYLYNTSAVVTVKNSSSTNYYYAVEALSSYSGEITLENNCFTCTKYAVYMLAGTLTIESGTYISEEVAAVYVLEGAVANVNGGAYYGTRAGILVLGTVSYPEGYILNNQPNEDGYYVLIAEEDYVECYVAAVGETQYTSVEEALAAMEDGDTVVLLADAYLVANYTIGESGAESLASYTIDLNGYTLDLGSFYLTNYDRLTFVDSSEEKSGLLMMNGTYGICYYAGLVLEGITCQVGGTYGFYGYCTDDEIGLQITNCTITGTGSRLTYQWTVNTAPIAITSSYIELSGTIYFYNNDEVTITDSTIVCTGSNYAIYLWGSSAVITNCTISAGEDAKYAVYVSYTGYYINTVIIDGGYYEGNTTAVYVNGDRSLLIILDGEFVARSAVTTEDEAGNESTEVVTGEYAVISGARTLVYGGYFMATEAAVDGFTLLENGKKLALIETSNDEHEGWFTVTDQDGTEEEADEAYVAYATYSDGTTAYITDINNLFLLFGIDTVTTIQLLSDATIAASSYVLVTKGHDIVLDLNGYTLTVNMKDLFQIYLEGSLRITDSSEAGTGAIVSVSENAYASLFNTIIGSVTIEAGNFSAPYFIYVTSTGCDTVISGGTFEIENSVIYYSMGGSTVVTGGLWSNKAAAGYIASGYTLVDDDEDGWYTVEALESGYAYPVSYSIVNPLTQVTYEEEQAYVTVGTDGVAYLNIIIPSTVADSIELASIVNAEGSSVFAEIGTEIVADEDGNESSYVLLTLPLSVVYGDESDTAILGELVGSECAICFDWASYEGPVGESTAYEVSVNHTGTAMSSYDFNTTEVLYIFENGYSYLLLNMDYFFEAMGYERGGKYNTGALISVLDENENTPVYVNAAYEALYSEKFGDFDSVTMVLVALNDGQELLSTSIEFLVDAMGFSVTLNDTVTWTNPDTSLTLAELIAQAEALSEEDYTEESWSVLSEALAEAKAVEENEEATEEEISEAWSELYSAIVNLSEIETVDWSELEAALAEAEALNEEDYTADSWATLQAALDNAYALEESATQAQVDAYLSAITKALGKLESADAEEQEGLAAGTYQVAVDLRKSTDSSSSSMASFVMDDEATLIVNEDGTLTLILTFPEGATYASIVAHATGMTVYDEAGNAMEVTYVTYDATSSAGEAVTAISEAAITLTYQAEDGLYWAYMQSDFMSAELYLYVDFDNAVEIKVLTEIRTEELTASAITEELAAAGFTTVEEIEEELISVAITEGYSTDNSVVYEVTLYISTDNGETWTEATEEDFPADGITITLPYPDGTNAEDYVFYAIHMFSVTSETLGTTAGDCEILTGTNTASGVELTLKGLSPVMLIWTEVAADEDEDEEEAELEVEAGEYDVLVAMYIDAMKNVTSTYYLQGTIIVDEDGNASLYVDFTQISADGETWADAYESATVYYLAFNGYSTDGTSASLTTEGAVVTDSEVTVTTASGTTYSCIESVTFPLPYLTVNSDGEASYLISMKFYVPAMASVATSFADGFDYDTVVLTIDLSDVPVKTTEATEDDEATTTPSTSTSSVPTGLTGLAGLTLAGLGVQTGDASALPYAAAAMLALIAILGLAWDVRRRQVN